MYNLEINPGHLTLSQLRRVNSEAVQLSLNPDCLEGIAAATKTVQNVIAQGRTVYGVNTGFGLLANTHIPDEELK